MLGHDGAAALQVRRQRGLCPLREAIADLLPWNVDPDQVLITTGSQQALDLIAKVLIDEGSRVLVETPPTWARCRPYAHGAPGGGCGQR